MASPHFLLSSTIIISTKIASVIKEYFEVQKKNESTRREEEKALKYSEMFVQNISKGYISDYYKRRKNLGFDDDF